MDRRRSVTTRRMATNMVTGTIGFGDTPGSSTIAFGIPSQMSLSRQRLKC